jgi:hypothetical protein
MTVLNTQMPHGKKGVPCPTQKALPHAMKVAACMKANPGMSLAAASKKVAAMNKK